MHEIIVDTTGACMAPDYGNVGLRPSSQRRTRNYESTPTIPCGVRPVLVGLGRGWAAFGPPFFVCGPSNALFQAVEPSSTISAMMAAFALRSRL
jgi:hypothetical protein